jgi:hypothetical protein
MSIEREIKEGQKFINKDTKTVVQIKGEGHDRTAVVTDPGNTNLSKGQEISHRNVIKEYNWDNYE